jgi:polysaccharide export outer membrane protein
MCRSARDRARLRLKFFIALATFLPGVSSFLSAQSPSVPPGSTASPQGKVGPIVPEPASLRRGYRIGTGDVLQIVVYKEPDASAGDVTVRSDGKISMPMLGDVEVQGLAPSELEKSLELKLARFINEPEVTVLVRSVQSERIYVIGKVRREGPIRLVGPMTIMQALSEAGGPTEFAKATRIYLLRSDGPNQFRIPFNYKDVVRGRHSEQNILVQAGDTVVVP